MQYCFFCFICCREIEGNFEPSSYSEAIISGDSKKWMTTMHDEMESLEKNVTWDLVKLPREETYSLQVGFQEERRCFS